jgi:hypothetical protein
VRRTPARDLIMLMVVLMVSLGLRMAEISNARLGIGRILDRVGCRLPGFVAGAVVRPDISAAPREQMTSASTVPVETAATTPHEIGEAASRRGTAQGLSVPGTPAVQQCAQPRSVRPWRLCDPGILWSSTSVLRGRIHDATTDVMCAHANVCPRSKEQEESVLAAAVARTGGTDLLEKNKTQNSQKRL